MRTKKFTDKQIIAELRDVAEKYRGKSLDTFETDIFGMTTDASNHIEIMVEEKKQILEETREKLKSLIDNIIKGKVYTWNKDSIDRFIDEIEKKYIGE